MKPAKLPGVDGAVVVPIPDAVEVSVHVCEEDDPLGVHDGIAAGTRHHHCPPRSSLQSRVEPFLFSGCGVPVPSRKVDTPLVLSSHCIERLHTVGVLRWHRVPTKCWQSDAHTDNGPQKAGNGQALPLKLNHRKATTNRCLLVSERGAATSADEPTHRANDSHNCTELVHHEAVRWRWKGPDPCDNRQTPCSICHHRPSVNPHFQVSVLPQQAAVTNVIGVQSSAGAPEWLGIPQGRDSIQYSIRAKSGASVREHLLLGFVLPHLLPSGEIDTIDTAVDVLKDNRAICLAVTHGEEGQEVPHRLSGAVLPQHRAIRAINAQHHVRHGLVHVLLANIQNHQTISRQNETVVTVDALCCDGHLPQLQASFHVNCMKPAVSTASVDASIHQGRSVHQVIGPICDSVPPRPQQHACVAKLEETLQDGEEKVPSVVNDRTAHDHGLVPAFWVMPAPPERG
mmetsp:Transcript_38910/g.103391  ORF Transcript_38910/g.103391 Transcript_38910/m.103391 type:complete len:455 (+) Transcript_38910:177-1541(+)